MTQMYRWIFYTWSIWVIERNKDVYRCIRINQYYPVADFRDHPTVNYISDVGLKLAGFDPDMDSLLERNRRKGPHQQWTDALRCIRKATCCSGVWPAWLKNHDNHGPTRQVWSQTDWIMDHFSNLILGRWGIPVVYSPETPKFVAELSEGWDVVPLVFWKKSP